MYLLQGKPIGIYAAKSVLESLEGLEVKARKIEGQVVVTKREILRKLKEKKSMFISCWKNASPTSFSFNLTDCKKM